MCSALSVAYPTNPRSRSSASCKPSWMHNEAKGDARQCQRYLDDIPIPRNSKSHVGEVWNELFRRICQVRNLWEELAQKSALYVQIDEPLAIGAEGSDITSVRKLIANLDPFEYPHLDADGAAYPGLGIGGDVTVVGPDQSTGPDPDLASWRVELATHIREDPGILGKRDGLASDRDQPSALSADVDPASIAEIELIDVHTDLPRSYPAAHLGGARRQSNPARNPSASLESMSEHAADGTVGTRFGTDEQLLGVQDDLSGVTAVLKGRRGDLTTPLQLDRLRKDPNDATGGIRPFGQGLGARLKSAKEALGIAPIDPKQLGHHGDVSGLSSCAGGVDRRGDQAQNTLPPRRTTAGLRARAAVRSTSTEPPRTAKSSSVAPSTKAMAF